jgi:hypothetical protein
MLQDLSGAQTATQLLQQQHPDRHAISTCPTPTRPTHPPAHKQYVVIGHGSCPMGVAGPRPCAAARFAALPVGTALP